ncbi:fatty acid desaturase [Calothrix sp. NIES-2098]|nr:fatty acid desaturase [Calothrix sp. NIES-2098]
METTVSVESASINRATDLLKKRTMSNSYIKLLQKRHFLLCDVLPFVGFILAIACLWGKPIGVVDIAVFLGMWFLTSVGITVGYHRYFTHRAFQAHPIVRILLVILGSTGAEGPVLSWVANHRHHHRYSDEVGDTHSPHLHGTGWRNQLYGFWHAHLWWKVEYDYPNPLYYAPELLRDKTICKLNQLYFVWVILGLVFPAVVAFILTGNWIGTWYGFLWGGVIRLYLGQQTTWCINSICHLFGTRAFDTKEKSTNNLWLALPTFGESWHNNHHAFQNSAKFGLQWWQIDIGYWVIVALQSLGLAWDVNQPTPEMMQSKSVRSL